MFISSLLGLNRMSEQNQSEIIIYQTEDGLTRVNVTFSDETVWLSQQQIAELFQKSRIRFTTQCPGKRLLR